MFGKPEDRAMKAYDFVHLVLHAASGKVQGRTKLQKMVYFAGVLTGMLEELGYRAHYYGPYSSTVSAAVEELRSLGFLEQRVASGGAIDPQGFEVARYDYELTDDGKQIAKEKAHVRKHMWEKIKQAVEQLNNADVSDYMKLSIAAKAYFLVNRAREPVTVGKLVEMSERFGWKVSKKQISEATEWLESLKLVEDEHDR
jgi:uncharacterized protein YwgA